MIQDTRTYVIVYRPRFLSPGRWFAWVLVSGQRDLKWWPVSEREALEWYAKNMPPGRGLTPNPRYLRP